MSSLLYIGVGKDRCYTDQQNFTAFRPKNLRRNYGK
jgi:hypothetical protein